jgi:hypothetical protein
MSTAFMMRPGLHSTDDGWAGWQGLAAWQNRHSLHVSSAEVRARRAWRRARMRSCTHRESKSHVFSTFGRRYSLLTDLLRSMGGTSHVPSRVCAWMVRKSCPIHYLGIYCGTVGIHSLECWNYHFPQHRIEPCQSSTRCCAMTVPADMLRVLAVR